MEELGLVGDLAVVAVAATIGGAAARMLRLPALIGYLLAGLAISPHTPGFVGDIEQTRTIADLGVALLMFTLGLRFSLRQLLEMRQVAVIGGLTQVSTVLLVGGILGTVFGLSWKESVVLGMVASISSTMLALRLLEDRGQIDSLAGRLGVTFALSQDLAVVLLLASLPLLGEGDQDVLVSLPVALGKAALFLIGAALMGIFLPRIITLGALSGGRELFILGIVGLALGAASVSALAGLSLAFGAFLAGLVISESEYAHQTLTQIRPLREIFAVAFFVAVGMLIDPSLALDHPEIVLAILIAGVGFKAAIIAGISRGFGYPPAPVATAALALANTGEFSFIITEEASDEGVVDATLVSSLLTGVFASLALGVPMMALDTRLVSLVAKMPSRQSSEIDARTATSQANGLVNHAVICGFGEGARELTSALESRGFRYIIIDEDPPLVRRLREEGLSCVLGDPSLRTVLEQVGLNKARVLAVTLANVGQAEDVVREARALNPRLDVIARGWGPESHGRLLGLGASEVVHPDLEIGLELMRHTLHRFGVSSREIQLATAGRRRRYRS